MKNWKRLLALLLSGAMALSLCACKTDESAGSPSPEPSAEASADPSSEPSATPEIVADLTQGPLEFSAGLSAGDVLLTVNGDEVHADLFLYLLAMNCMQAQPYLSYLGLTLDNMAESLLSDTVNMAAYHVIMRQKAAELGCLLTDAQTEEVRKSIEESDLEAVAPYWGLTDESGEFIFAMTPYYNNVLEAATHEPSDEELDSFIAEKGVFAVKHILLKTTDDDNQPLPEEEAAQKKSTAEDLLAQLQAAEDMPALFDELMKANSDDSGLESNPDGYVFDADDSLVDGFREAALALEVGGLSGLVETDYGYHIMLRLPLSDETRAEYQESFRPDALEKLADQWQQEAEITQADALTSLNVVSYYDRMAAYQKALEEQLNPSAAPTESESGGAG